MHRWEEAVNFSTQMLSSLIFYTHICIHDFINTKDYQAHPLNNFALLYDGECIPDALSLIFKLLNFDPSLCKMRESKLKNLFV